MTNIDEGAEKCAHKTCNCPVEPGQQYCSDVCRGDMTAVLCQCGHSGCAVEQ